MEKWLVIIGSFLGISIILSLINRIIRLRIQRSSLSGEEKQQLLKQLDEYKDRLQQNSSPETCVACAKIYQQLGQFEEAVHILEQGLNHHANHIDMRLELAKCTLTQGQVDTAKRHLHEVVQDIPQHFLAQKVLGEIAMQQQNYEEAVTHFGAAYSLQPDAEEPKVMLEYLGSLLRRNVLAEFQQGSTSSE